MHVPFHKNSIRYALAIYISRQWRQNNSVIGLTFRESGFDRSMVRW